MKKKNLQKCFIVITAIICLVLLFFFFKDIVIDLIRFEKENNQEAVKNLLQSKGIIGMLAVIVIQALQMVVVFISAEFIQISTGISFPFLLSIILLELGVFLGASIIFLLVRSLKFDSDLFKSSNKINNFVKRDKKKNRTAQSLMYILFVTPIIPFGAICYYGSSTKISYKRYIFTCITGVLPSIITSILIGDAFTKFLNNDIPVIYLVLIILGLMGILLGAVLFIINKLYFKKNEGTPDSVFYNILLLFFSLLVRIKSRPTFDRSKLNNIEGPFILLSNHASFYDMYYLCKLVYPHRLSIIGNRYYFRIWFFNKMFSKIGVIPKKLFYPDIETIRKSMTSIKNGYSILMCPEGRLSIDGSNYNITVETSKLLKKLNVPVVIANINGAYLTNPKWRKKRILGPVHTEVKHIITKEELNDLSLDEINDIVNKNITYNDFEYARKHEILYLNKNKMLGAETVLYHCPKCHKDYVMKSKNNKLYCENCGFEVETNINYSFNKNELDIIDFNDFYNRIIKFEKENIITNGINLECEVTVKKFNFNDKKYDIPGEGITKLTKEGFSFKGIVNNEEIEFFIPITQLFGLAFSCNEEFECYYNDELYYFYPKTNKVQCTKWSLIVDILNESKGEVNG